ncbi:hypothetical protein BMR06_06835 [Methylococcaceae bacterium HT5]|nr:hypothetical protein BMR06_06835 [Methylococcaceae bacterium HT5]
MQFVLLSRAASTRRISELPCRLSGTKNHHFAKLRFHDFQRLLQREPVSAKELARVKAQVMASSVYEQDSLFYQAMKLGMAETVGLGWQKSE